MSNLATYLGDFRPSGVLSADVSQFLSERGYPKTAEHCMAVAHQARELAERYASDALRAEQAGYLHDISAVVPNPARAALAHSLGIEVLVEEESFPMILHQKLSVVLAQAAFSMQDPAVLSAIGCHTTLKAGATRLDKVVFLADKIAWDQSGAPPYLAALQAALPLGLDAAVLVYLNYLWDLRAHLRVVHPWFLAARQELLHPGT